MSHASTTGQATPLYVDLDGTLIATDLLWESFFELARRRPWELWRVPLWVLGGRARLKQELADRVQLDVEALPYRPEVLEYVRSARAQGRSTVLATASEGRFARAVAEHLGLFDDVIATEDGVNRKGAAKLAAIQAHSPSRRFDYIGDSRADLPLWRAAERAIVAAPGAGVMGLLRQEGKSCESLRSSEPAAKPWWKALRPHQWAKNVLIFVPLVTAHKLTQWPYLLPALLGFVAFCLVASAVYILNDLLDLPSDRRHAQKRFRPLAAGELAIPHALVLMVGLLVAALGMCWALPWKFGLVLLGYVLLTTAYSALLKRKLMVDVLCLAGLYTVRILAGGAASAIVISPWLMAFSLFFFLSLAFAKRYTELDSAGAAEGKLPGRGYLPEDIELIRTLGPTSGYISVLVACLYLNSPDVRSLYQHPFVLWLVCPLLLYWITRLWFLAQRHQLPHDPVLFAVRDRHSYVVGALVAVLLVAAKF